MPTSSGLARPLLPLRSRTAPADLGREEDALQTGRELAQSIAAASFTVLLLACIVTAFSHRQSVGHVTKDLVQEMIDLEPVEAGLLLFSITAVANVLCLPSFGLWIGAGVVFVHIYHENVLESAVAGTLAVFGGLMFGGLAAFTLGRTLCQRCILKRLQHLEWVEVLNAIVATEGWKFVLLARLSPMLPLEAFSYACSITRLSFTGFTLGCFGSLPVTFFWVWMGASAESLRMAANSDETPGFPVRVTLFMVGLSFLAFGAIAYLSTTRYQRIMEQRIPSMAHQRIAHSQEHLSLDSPSDEAYREELRRLQRSARLRHWRGMLSPQPVQ